MCKSITTIHANLHEHDLELIKDLPKLEILSILTTIQDINYFKAFQQMNFSNLKYLFLNKVNTKTEFDRVFEELSNIYFPSLKRLTVENHFDKEDKVSVVSVTEQTLEKLIKKIPSLKSLNIGASIDFVSEISFQFMFKMLKDEDVVIMVGLAEEDEMERYIKNIKHFLKKKGSIFYKKWKSLRRELCEQWWMSEYAKDPH